MKEITKGYMGKVVIFTIENIDEHIVNCENDIGSHKSEWFNEYMTGIVSELKLIKEELLKD